MLSCFLIRSTSSHNVILSASKGSRLFTYDPSPSVIREVSSSHLGNVILSVSEGSRPLARVSLTLTHPRIVILNASEGSRPLAILSILLNHTPELSS